MNKVRFFTKIALAASVSLAMAFTFSSCAGSKPKYVECSGHDPETHFCDNRDGQTYKYDKIGTQVWMLENLNYGNAPTKKSVGCNAIHILKPSGETIEDLMANAAEICKRYGSIYNWSKAQKSCPEGWHLPSYDEWQTLVLFADPNFVSDEVNVAGTKLKAKTDWTNGMSVVASGSKDLTTGEVSLKSGGGTFVPVGNGTDDFGFSAFPGGGIIWKSSQEDYAFDNFGTFGFWWTSTETKSKKVYRIGMGYNVDYVYKKEDTRYSSFSVRCIKD